MILDLLVLHNFGPFLGRHHLELTPESKEKPIILIGGMNGAGKTSLLDALQLVLYGKRASCSNRDGKPYEEYLGECVHRGVALSEGAAIELHFRVSLEGEETELLVHRSWRDSGKGIRERVEVVQDGRASSLLTEQWDSFVEELLPANLARLFFFDGEKIEKLADPAHSAEVLSTAMHALLGLDLIDRLHKDLDILARKGFRLEGKGVEGTALAGKRQREAQQSALEIRKIECETAVEAYEKERSGLRQEMGALVNRIDILLKERAGLEQEFEAKGGSLFLRHKELEEESRRLNESREKLEEEMRKLAEGPAPLLLVTDLLAAVEKQASVEWGIQQANTLVGVLEERDKALLHFLKTLNFENGSVSKVRKHLLEDRSARTTAHDSRVYLHLGDEDLHELINLRSTILPQVHETIGQLILKWETSQEEIVRIERELASVPPEEMVAFLKDKLDKNGVEQDVTRRQEAELQGRLRATEVELERRRKELSDTIAIWHRTQFEGTEDERLLLHSQRVQGTLDALREAVLHQHLQRIGQLVLEGFQHLLRKKKLIASIAICPKDFSLELMGLKGRTILPKRLSAAERQLLAVSLFWGLARASAKPLPTVIDTPLGRMDSGHRGHLVDRYFPNASHQVLLLSTDEEINEKYFEKLVPHISRSLLLEHDDATNTTQILDGYFWGRERT